MKDVKLPSLRFGKDSDDRVKRKLILFVALLALVTSNVPFITSPAHADYNWSNIGNPGVGGPVDCLTSDGSIIYAGTDDTGMGGEIGIHKYDGTEWSTISDYYFANALMVIEGNVYVGTPAGVYAYNGTSWNFTDGPEITPSTNSLAYDSGVLYATTQGGEHWGFRDSLHALKSTWQEMAELPIQRGPRETHNLAVLSSEIYAGFEGEGVFRYDNAGSWTNTGCPSYENVILSHGSNLYAGGGRSVFKYDGSSWVDIGMPDPNRDDRVYCLTAVGSDIYAGTGYWSGSVYKYDGSSWIDTNLRDVHPGDQISSLTNDGTNLYAGTRDGDVYRCPSTPSSNTTTTTNGGSCPSEQIFGEHSKETELLRHIRDNVLRQTPEGQEIIRLYYKWSPVIVKAMEEDEEFKEEVKELIDEVLGLVGGKRE